MRWLLRILILAGVLQAILGVGVALADTVIQIEITATGNASASCPTVLTATPSSDYLINLTWVNATGNDTLGTVIRVDYGAYPASPTAGDLVYSGNGTSTTHSVNMGVLTEDIYYRAWTIYAGPTYSVCYTSATVEVPGVAPTGGVIFDTQGLTDMADLMRVGLILGFPILFGLIGVLRASLTGYVVGVVGLCLATTYIWDGVGTMLGIPMLLVIFGLLMSAMRNALSEGLRIF